MIRNLQHTNYIIHTPQNVIILFPVVSKNWTIEEDKWSVFAVRVH